MVQKKDYHLHNYIPTDTQVEPDMPQHYSSKMYLQMMTPYNARRKTPVHSTSMHQKLILQIFVSRSPQASCSELSVV